MKMVSDASPGAGTEMTDKEGNKWFVNSGEELWLKQCGLGKFAEVEKAFLALAGGGQKDDGRNLRRGGERQDANSQH